MASDLTEHYGLHLWEGDDHFLRTEFNDDNRRIDTALQKKCEVLFGSYLGNGAASRFIPLGFTPRVVILVDKNGVLSESNMSGYDVGGIAVQGGSTNGALALVSGGFQVFCDERRLTNMASYGPFSYLAFR